MTTSTEMKRNDTAPALVLTCMDDTDPVDLSTATAVKVLGTTRTGAAVFSRTLSGSSVGVVTMPWQAADTAESGALYVEVEVTWPDGTVQTFPREGHVTVTINDDLG